ncbi:hypothetical protein HPB50_025207 [Hyalomma asiaticum]|uniref:Uncharacterized protein n=1 Tax=Hyalomma asiaticum TaxID=266040 RepID=A0ACB7S419_HYAAI|nr:hypothetical protein HPB50_025207 [Hyalomma asiaticum]
MGAFSAASSRTRPRFPGALQQTSPVREASYTILRRPPTTNDGVRSMQPTEAQQSNEVDHKPCADGKGESRAPATSHLAVGRGAAFRTRGWRPRRGTGTLLRRGQSAAERCCRTTVEHYYEQEDWEKAEDGGDRKTTKKEGKKRVHWEEENAPGIECSALEQTGESAALATSYEEEDWEPECAPLMDSSEPTRRKPETTVTWEREAEHRFEQEAPATSQSNREKMAKDEAWKRGKFRSLVFSRDARRLRRNALSTAKMRAADGLLNAYEMGTGGHCNVGARGGTLF